MEKGTALDLIIMAFMVVVAVCLVCISYTYFAGVNEFNDSQEFECPECHWQGYPHELGAKYVGGYQVPCCPACGSTNVSAGGWS